MSETETVLKIPSVQEVMRSPQGFTEETQGEKDGRTGAETVSKVSEEVVGEGSHIMRDIGIGMSSVMTTHFSSAVVKTFPSGYDPRARSTKISRAVAYQVHETLT